MYQKFFNFNTAPFSIAPDPHFIYMSEHHQEGLAHLLYGINQGGGFVALTGEVGTGKTTLCHCLLQQLPDNIDIALVLNPKLNAIELLATICDELQIAYNEDKQTLKSLIDHLNNYLIETHASGRRAVLIIDEAQNLSLDVLEQIRLLTNLETSKTKLLQIILLGQPELKQLLEKPELRQLNQRITARYHLFPLSYLETQKYIKHRLSLCGGNTGIFNRSAIKKVYKLSNGIPRLINIICDRALLGAYVTDRPFVTAKIIKKAAKEIFNSSPAQTSPYLKYVLSGLVFSVILSITAYYRVTNQSEKKQLILTGSFKKPDVAGIQQQPPVEHKIEAQKPAPLVFNSFLRLHNVSLDKAIPMLAELWDKDISQGFDCKEIKTLGLYCLFDKSDWKDLIALNRPVIMEFSLPESEKVYALLIGFKDGQAVFLASPDIAFPVEQVLALWNGYYLMLWQSPVQNVETVYPGLSSNAVLWIRKQIALNQNESIATPNSTFFDNELKTAVTKFQQQHHLITDGIVGPRTFIHLSNNDPQNNSPKLSLSH